MNTRIRSSRKNRKQPNNRNRVRTKTNSDRRVIEKQTRSGDEPSTLFITCLECGNVFTM